MFSLFFLGVFLIFEKWKRGRLVGELPGVSGDLIVTCGTFFGWKNRLWGARSGGFRGNFFTLFFAFLINN